jgi:hypothetical protein
METGSELSKTVATFIVQKILLDDVGLQYICHTYERFSHVALILVSAAGQTGGRLGACEGVGSALERPRRDRCADMMARCLHRARWFTA